MKYNNVLETIGRTPEVRINRLFGNDHEVWLKLERLRAVADVDDRLCRGDSDAGFGPQHAVADGEDARLNGAAQLSSGGVIGENGERADRPGLVFGATVVDVERVEALEMPRHPPRYVGQVTTLGVGTNNYRVRRRAREGHVLDALRSFDVLGPDLRLRAEYV
jgi:hypothetical protein